MIIPCCHSNQSENWDLLGFVIEKGDFSMNRKCLGLRYKVCAPYD